MTGIARGGGVKRHSPTRPRMAMASASSAATDRPSRASAFRAGSPRLGVKRSRFKAANPRSAATAASLARRTQPYSVR